ncbi:mitochondrial fission 1 protein isoform X1 [Anopheles aquasalis]|nr:mitochondrial fission 1 protein isoform X1 [Anopheles aquasalis]
MEEILNDNVLGDELECYYDLLQKFEKKYNAELRLGPVSTTTQFEYAWCMVRSEFKSDMKRGILLLEDLFAKHPEGRRDYLYYLAIGHARLQEYSESLKHAQAFLEIEPNNQQVIALEQMVKKRMEIEGIKGVAKATGAALVVGGILGLGLALLKK